jgi:hypothetical protein
MKDSSDFWISESAAPAGTGAYLGVEGTASGNILLSGCDLRAVKESVALGSDLSPQTVTASGNIVAQSKIATP